MLPLSVMNEPPSRFICCVIAPELIRYELPPLKTAPSIVPLLVMTAPDGISTWPTICPEFVSWAVPDELLKLRATLAPWMVPVFVR